MNIVNRPAALLFLMLLAACQQEKASPAPRAKKPLETRLQATLQLPNDDGRVYVIESPADDFGFEVNSCMLHVKGNASTMACTPPKMKLPLVSDENS